MSFITNFLPGILFGTANMFLKVSFFHCMPCLHHMMNCYCKIQIHDLSPIKTKVYLMKDSTEASHSIPQELGLAMRKEVLAICLMCSELGKQTLSSCSWKSHGTQLLAHLLWELLRWAGYAA